MIGSVVVLYNPSIQEIENLNIYIEKVDYAVVIDNSNTDNQSLIYKTVSNSEKIHYYSEHKNLGLCKGFNIGVNILAKKSCEWALLLDADSKLDPDIISVYKETLNIFKSRNDIAVFSPVHIFDRSKATRYVGYRNVDWSMTSGWLVNIKIFQKQNGFFEGLFVDGLDMDYCYKSHENGYEIIECGQAVINHNPAETRSVFGIKYGIASPNRYYMQARQLIWCWKRYKKITILGIYFYKWMKVLILFPNKLNYIKAMKLGSKNGILLWNKYS
ncbi:glycosyltransferase [Dubosiella newyorkensis]|uniref:glycosyltransferase n=1 Tax=Dubosiella newyorkensis TaxID=1862672 RepID=UPI00248BBC47|nr:glycosyltransferase [Dubosiella newyorkensis]